jgi:hypothetical protein
MGVAMIGPAEGEELTLTNTDPNPTIAIFFDGTGNNMFNTDEHTADIKNKAIMEKEEQQRNIPKFINGDTRFTDATANQMTPKEYYSKPTKNVYEKNTDHDTSSYENAYSNVVWLFKNYNDNKTTIFKQYIQGIGTVKLQKDDTLDGTALGRYQHGIPARVAEACKMVADTLVGFINSNKTKTIELLTIDLFGFSRGSAAARHFVYEIYRGPYKTDSFTSGGFRGIPKHTYYIDKMGNQTEFAEFPFRGYLGAYCKQNNIQINNINVRFIGLFDCVASYSKDLIGSAVFDVHPEETPDAFQDDTRELDLDFIATQAKRVVHLTAGDEHRANFPLTDTSSVGVNSINANGASSKRTELVLPGVHSDVGGCYEDKKDEIIERLIQMDTTIENVVTEFFLNKFRKEEYRLILEGWYKQDELSSYNIKRGGGISFYPLPEFSLVQRCLKGSRSSLRNTYSYIPLHIMGQFAIEFDKKINPIPFNLDKLTKAGTSTTIIGDGLLGRIKKRLWDYAFNRGQPITLSFMQPNKRERIDETEPTEKYYQALPDATAVKNQAKMMPIQILSQEDKDLLDLRHGYLHFSAKYDRSAGIIIPNYPCIDNDGHRKRLILPG